ncbi:hypothetical protein J2T13_000841 [Paenibacillus sp. DS2015]|uniref:hypothetical protein n=1 Tax=Paenibacillus sp. DS2015 TaxID=3373917 RepID=UPI003D1A6893
MNDKITEIKEALGKATPGPWEIEKRYDGYMVVQRETFEVICSGKLHEETENNHNFIAKSPEYITYLLQLVETQSKALDRIHCESTDPWAVGYALRVMQGN